MFCEDGLSVLETFQLVNLAISKEDSFRTRVTRAELYSKIGWYDEAEEEYKLALYYEEDIKAMQNLMYIELMLDHTFLAIEFGEKIRKRKDEADHDLWEGVRLLQDKI